MSSETSRISVADPRKSRLRIIAKHPLPNHNFLAPYDCEEPLAMDKLQLYIYKQLSLHARSLPAKDLMDSLSPRSLQLEMDRFAIPFDAPDLLRDGDTIEVCIPTAGLTMSDYEDRQLEASDDDGSEDTHHNVIEPLTASTGERSSAIALSTDSEDSDEDMGDEVDTESPDSSDEDSSSNGESGSMDSGLPADERAALLEGRRIAALLQGGILQALPDDEEDAIDRTLSHALATDLPAMPAPPQSSASKVPSSSTVPSLPVWAGSSSAAAAMAAFHSRKNQLQSIELESRATVRQPISKAMIPPINVTTETLGKRETSSSSNRTSTKSRSAEESDSESDTGSDNSSSSSSSDDSSSSDSAPSEEPVKKIRRAAEKTKDAAEPVPEERVPPGKGTSRTKRRNLLRRKKLLALKQSINEVNFLAAQDRAKEREGADVRKGDDGVTTPTDVDEDSEVSSSSSTVIASDRHDKQLQQQVHEAIEPQATTAITNAAGKKRKREEDSPVLQIEHTPDAQDFETRSYAVRTVPPSELPPDQIPSCITIRSIDCNEYYETELRKLEQSKDVTGTQDDNKVVGGAKKAATSLTFATEHLNYGEADALPQASSRKRPKIASNDAESVESKQVAFVTVDDDSTSSDEEADRESKQDAQIWIDIECKTPQHYLQIKLSQTFALDSFALGSKVIFRDIALHPVRRLPEMMVFIGIVRRFSDSSVELDVRGPIFETAQWEALESEARTWTSAYHPDELAIF